MQWWKLSIYLDNWRHTRSSPQRYNREADKNQIKTEPQILAGHIDLKIFDRMPYNLWAIGFISGQSYANWCVMCHFFSLFFKERKFILLLSVLYCCMWWLELLQSSWTMSLRIIPNGEEEWLWFSNSFIEWSCQLWMT